MVLQALEGLTDRDAIQQLRTNIAWKVAADLALDDPGFHPTVLTLWRNRLRVSERPQRIFEAVGEVVRATGVLSGRQRRALDSTVLDDAVIRQDLQPKQADAVGLLALVAGQDVEPGRRRGQLADRPADRPGSHRLGPRPRIATCAQIHVGVPGWLQGAHCHRIGDRPGHRPAS